MFSPMNNRIVSLLFFVLLGSVQPAFGQGYSHSSDTMTLEEKVGQLFMVAAYSNKDAAHIAQLNHLAKTYHIGGIIVMQGTRAAQRSLIDEVNSYSKYGLFVAQDAEWGTAMRLKDSHKWPTALTIGATGDSALAYRWGKAIGEDCKKVGVHMNFGPVLDVNTNAANPIIGVRSFGSQPNHVARLSIAAAWGQEHTGVISCAKHFPGHGDTHQDSHKTLPKVESSIERIREVEWVPFQQYVDNGLSAMMIAHLNIPALEPSGKPTSLSKRVVADILREQWMYNGLLFTDALNMKGVSKYAPPGELELEALLAGNDILLFPEDVPKAHAMIVKAVKEGKVSEERITQSVNRLREAYELATAMKDNCFRPESPNELHVEIIESATTLVQNTANALPLPISESILHVYLGHPEVAVFNEYLGLYGDVTHMSLAQANAAKETVSKASRLVVSYHQDPASPWKRYKLNAAEKKFIASLSGKNQQRIFVQMGNPYGVMALEPADWNSVVLGYENDSIAQAVVPQLLFGAKGFKGALPVDLNEAWQFGQSIKTKPLELLSYGNAGRAGFAPGMSAKIDSIVAHAIQAGATPGAQVLVAYKGEVVHFKAYGNHRYNEEHPVQRTDLYDVASITKIAATLPGMMQWYDENPKIIDETMGGLSRSFQGTALEHLFLGDVLLHQSGLPAWIPFYAATIENDSTMDYWYRSQSEIGYMKIADNLYIRSSIQDTVFSRVCNAEMKEPVYRYSDLGYYTFMHLLEKRWNEPLDQWVHHWLYAPMGMHNTGYKPLNWADPATIVPSEKDIYWRNTEIHGTVHDMGAALMGGVGGHAGIFSNANDLAKLMQMYMEKGIYGNTRYISPKTLEFFTECPLCEEGNRRGYGFDKPQLEGNGPACLCTSPGSFGHTGFTGTMAWADPQHQLVYVFLSNRTYPSMENWKLSKLDVRTNIQEVIYNHLPNY